MAGGSQASRPGVGAPALQAGRTPNRKVPPMDDFWLNRDEVERRLPPDTIAFDTLTYDYEMAMYCLNGQPFTGFTVQRHPDGSLESVVTFRDGVEDGVSVVWFASGQIEQYAETRGELLQG